MLSGQCFCSSEWTGADCSISANAVSDIPDQDPVACDLSSLSFNDHSCTHVLISGSFVPSITVMCSLTQLRVSVVLGIVYEIISHKRKHMVLLL